MSWRVRYLDEFRAWWDGLDADEQETVEVSILLLKEKGPHLPFPHSSKIAGSAFAMFELRIQHQGEPYRVLYVFDPERSAVLILGGKKTGDDRWYDREVPRADKLYQEYLDAEEE